MGVVRGKKKNQVVQKCVKGKVKKINSVLFFLLNTSHALLFKRQDPIIFEELQEVCKSQQGSVCITSIMQMLVLASFCIWYQVCLRVFSLNASPALQKELRSVLALHERWVISLYLQLALHAAHMGQPCHVRHILPTVLRQCGIADIRQIGGFLPRQLQYCRFPSAKGVVLCASL